MHNLQQIFAKAEGEQEFEDRLHALFATSSFDEVEAILIEQLETLDGPVADLCRELSLDAITVEGLEDVVDCVADREGEPVTTLVIEVANQSDLAFEKGRLHEPLATVGLFTDEAFPFASSPAPDVIAQFDAEDGPAWTGQEEDIELYLELEGFGPLNNALLFHKQRHFFRDDNPDQAPLRYVDYVVGCWWRALRIQQAVAASAERHLTPLGLNAVVSIENMRPELACVLNLGEAGRVDQVASSRAAAETASIAAENFIQRKVVEEEQEMSGSDLRRKVAESEPETVEAEGERVGFFKRLFGRSRAEKEAA